MNRNSPFGLVVGAVLEVLDVVTDIGLVVAYYQRAEYVFFGLMLAFVVLPGLLMTTISWRAFSRDEKIFGSSGYVIVLRRILLIFQLGPILHLVNLYYHTRSSNTHYGNNNTERYEKHEKAKEECEQTISTLTFVEGFLEAAPQLIVQYYSIVTLETDTNLPDGWPELNMDISIGASMALSFVSLVMSAVEYQQTVLGENQIDSLQRFGYILQFLWHGFTVLARSSAILMAVTGWVGATVVAGVSFTHWFLSFILLWMTLPKSEVWLHNKLWFKVFLAYVYVFTFFSAHQQPRWTLWLNVTYYSVFLAQNIAFTFLIEVLDVTVNNVIEMSDEYFFVFKHSYIALAPAILCLLLFYVHRNFVLNFFKKQEEEERLRYQGYRDFEEQQRQARERREQQNADLAQNPHFENDVHSTPAQPGTDSRFSGLSQQQNLPERPFNSNYSTQFYTNSPPPHPSTEHQEQRQFQHYPQFHSTAPTTNYPQHNQHLSVPEHYNYIPNRFNSQHPRQSSHQGFSGIRRGRQTQRQF